MLVRIEARLTDKSTLKVDARLRLPHGQPNLNMVDVYEAVLDRIEGVEGINPNEITHLAITDVLREER